MPEPTPSIQSSRRLSPWSPFSVADLLEDAPRVVAAWMELMESLGEEPRSQVLTDQLTWVVQGLGQWIAAGDGDIPEELRGLFRDLAFAYRSQGCDLDTTLGDLERLEDLLMGDGDPGEDTAMAANRELRRAMRTLWTETIQLNDTLSQRRDRERTDALESFEEILSHELGNRLGAARTGVDILQDAPEGLSDQRRQDLLELVGDGIDAALQTVEDVGAFVQAHRWADDHRQPFNEVVSGVVKGLGPQARSQGVALEMRPDRLPEVPVDAGRLRLILSNFLVNGIRYADQGEEQPWVRLTAEVRDDTLHVCVSDNGIGIPEEEKSDVFRFHHRGANHEEREGSGLGLTIASEAVNQLGGHIELESEHGVGTTLRVRLPVGTDEDAQDS